MTNNKEDNSVAKAANLHPVYTVTNIQHKVRVLDGKNVSYSSWVKLFQLHARGYEVLDHIDGTEAPAKADPNYDSWLKIDSIVLQWIYGTLSDDLLVRVLETESTALEAWNRIKKIFLNNKGARAATLEQEFTNLHLRSMPSLEAYCQRLKELSDQLADVDSPMTEQRLVLQLVRGLPIEYDTVGSYINQSLPSWDTACSMLQLEHHRQHARENPPTPPAPVVAAVDTPPNNPNRRTSNYRGGGRGNRRNGPDTRTDQRRPTGVQQQNAAPWPTRQHNSPANQNWNSTSGPWHNSGPQGFWPNWWQMPPPPCPYPSQPGWATSAPPNSGPSSGRSSSNPAQQSRSVGQAHLTDLDGLDPNDIGTAFSALTTDGMDDPWIMDTGATSHVTGDEGLHGWEDFNETG
ncbi:hypothetical protein HanRHA438_Chr12g0558761 [Helianthus annuus]|uniref:Uncharacterized protein n=1 Tax=Helianthus annuus TaxID=4232 RepID=A0A9K3HHF4_HELAN|nr:uncharacterized protein LOC110899164 [Helianthus annuus]KAF5778428.1 hypothetical protein HanXRQr2_Chr12g0547351 [Helianthus annuus]KAJ0489834.1 hypothetical protein HanHA300_Chr12g0448471 [Helianthus annuus]KAJ0505748.1 hypothetical protein HanHA89_Chr12g0473981 [Helianthus annuus]KAJ0675416.1 hypothetical protein HanLR1_Chr12g0450911 [Helianthus annuus]KAJ0678711.1 hypothetical protein HanOQP8_Chr12g0450971 [Helianthus annuus]